MGVKERRRSGTIKEAISSRVSSVLYVDLPEGKKAKEVFPALDSARAGLRGAARVSSWRGRLPETLKGGRRGGDLYIIHI